ncbi:hypothetical protein BKH41_01985 [Helicobacter sp. 12S02232-10]|uniref:GlcG/HbpS family heme-binding protein n=1 Tax=Helicobacter sp. 12S02232-10 TaxID=1476197 RepID=UPI000BA7928B|nr:heme-binding protein [Helicobacter sp. 12S02232-10]PAF49456.1 hypothetical protein BKH41_01985 [Helicobacter sp. 12S02232-10]
MLHRGLLIAILSVGFSIAQTLPKEPVLSLDVALKIAQNALKQCKNDGYKIAVNVLNKSGVVLVALRDQDAGPHTIEGSYKKAFTSVSTKTPTSVFAKKIEKNEMSSGLVNLSKNFVFASGGLPIKSENTTIGAIGVSGAPQGDLDEKCAQIGIDSVQKDLE